MVAGDRNAAVERRGFAGVRRGDTARLGCGDEKSRDGRRGTAMRVAVIPRTWGTWWGDGSRRQEDAGDKPWQTVTRSGMVTGAFFLLVSLFPEVHGFFCQIQTELRADAGGKEKEKEGKRQRKKTPRAGHDPAS